MRLTAGNRSVLGMVLEVCSTNVERLVQMCMCVSARTRARVCVCACADARRCHRGEKGFAVVVQRGNMGRWWVQKAPPQEYPEIQRHPEPRSVPRLRPDPRTHPLPPLPQGHSAPGAFPGPGRTVTSCVCMRVRVRARVLGPLAAAAHRVQGSAAVRLHTDQQAQTGDGPELGHEGVPLVEHRVGLDVRHAVVIDHHVQLILRIDRVEGHHVNLR